ncbi:MAG: hypothetical protein BGN97_03695 [Microbacterium sp. 69-10]|uniref:hypothetical protein n=1 Tax=Microbacterium sp. 69-10 TaxID=1895783 RepID=UPI000959D6B3|nr:hypothetical protein [Microbacterium sp. 69-10]OJU41815.1 MAG: hypothetical protein BGN97_03695 [Microbacterium sp. 69-10]
MPNSRTSGPLAQSAPLGPLFAPAYHRPWLRYIDAVPGAEGAPAGGSDPAPSAQTPPADPSAEPIDYKAKYEEAIGHSRQWEQRAKDNKAKADKFDAAEQEKLSEIEKANNRATAAEQASAANAALLLQLTAANENGITKDERALLTGTTEDELKAQVAAILKLRAPSAASPQDAGITGGGSSTPTTRAKTLAEAVAARITKK